MVFLDDLGVNLKAAQALGMKTIKVVDEEQGVQELSNKLNLNLFNKLWSWMKQIYYTIV